VQEIAELNARVREDAQALSRVTSEVGRVLVGQKRMVDRLLVALLADGHVLLEGVPISPAPSFTIRATGPSPRARVLCSPTSCSPTR
jgi:hypothetical protein